VTTALPTCTVVDQSAHQAQADADRRVETSTANFRAALLEEISLLLGYEAMRDSAARRADQTPSRR